MQFTRTRRTTSLRGPEKLNYDQETAYAILDEGYICHVSYDSDVPRVLPTAYARVDDTLYFHGSTGSRALLAGREDVEVCLAVTILDGLVYSRSWFHHSMNYRCVIAHGQARNVTDAAEKRRALAAIVDVLAPDRSNQSRPPTEKELSQTGVLALQLDEVSVKVRQGPPNDDAQDADLPYWAGVVPLAVVPQTAIPDTETTVQTPPGLPTV